MKCTKCGKDIAAPNMWVVLVENMDQLLCTKCAKKEPKEMVIQVV